MIVLRKVINKKCNKLFKTKNPPVFKERTSRESAVWNEEEKKFVYKDLFVSIIVEIWQASLNFKFHSEVNSTFILGFIVRFP